MIGYEPAIIVDSLPWWIALPLLQLLLLGIGMALDETYVNRTTTLAGALALYAHSLVTDGLWLPLSLYMELGVLVGLYGLYAYVVDGYVGNWFRVLAYFVYSPLSIFLLIVLPDLIFFVGLVVAGYANVMLLGYFRPAEPYYFGPETNAEFEAILDREADEGADAATSAGMRDESATGGSTGATPGGGSQSGSSTVGYADSGSGSGSGSGAVGPTADGPRGSGADQGPTERGILPEFMRRL